MSFNFVIWSIQNMEINVDLFLTLHVFPVLHFYVKRNIYWLKIYIYFSVSIFHPYFHKKKQKQSVSGLTQILMEVLGLVSIRASFKIHFQWAGKTKYIYLQKLGENSVLPFSMELLPWFFLEKNSSLTYIWDMYVLPKRLNEQFSCKWKKYSRIIFHIFPFWNCVH